MSDTGQVIAQKEYNDIAEKLFPLRRELNSLTDIIEDKKNEVKKLELQEQKYKSSIEELEKKIKTKETELDLLIEKKEIELTDTINAHNTVLIDIENQIKAKEILNEENLSIGKEIVLKNNELLVEKENIENEIKRL